MSEDEYIVDGPGSSSGTANWKELHLAALVESDRANLPEKIAKARSAIVQRTQELAGQEGYGTELNELWNALNSLLSLQNALRHNSQ